MIKNFFFQKKKLYFFDKTDETNERTNFVYEAATKNYYSLSLI